MRILSFLDACASREVLIEPWEGQIESVLAYSNIEKLHPAFGHQMRSLVYADRFCRTDGISLGRLEPGATVLGGDEFLLLCAGGGLLKDQVHPALRQNEERLSQIIGKHRDIQEISGEALLIGRFGIITWGHWLVEILPKMFLAE